ncbi:MAG: bifunctional nicotinamidase/pyrazinamidase [Myxococcales bacterium]|nr:bifunctional nicotinamidase/pyrazinamidase [Myxococcales bacterium]
MSMHPADHALILVDLQPDFLPGGALAVAEGDQVIPFANDAMQAFSCVVATQDWHPANHGSFASQHPGKAPGELVELHGLTQVLWPDHCVQGTPGAELCAELDHARITRVFRKGSDPTVDSYSGFFDNGRRHATGLGEWLKGEGIKALSVLGLATDYCVKFTALDARELGFDVTLLAGGCRGVELKPGDIANALYELRTAGVLIQS